jgi:hypothetical protein
LYFASTSSKSFSLTPPTYLPPYLTIPPTPIIMQFKLVSLALAALVASAAAKNAINGYATSAGLRLIELSEY